MTPLPWTHLFLNWVVVPSFALVLLYYSLKSFRLINKIRKEKDLGRDAPPKGICVFVLFIYAFLLLGISVGLTETALTYKPLVKVPKVQIVTPR